MLNMVLGRVYNAVLAFSILLFSSYTGNEPRFADFLVEVTENGIYFSCMLYEAFENDFRELFESGIMTSVSYQIDIFHQRNLIQRKTITNTAIYENEMRHWILQLGEDNNTLYVDSFEELKHNLSFLETFIYFHTGRYDNVELNISASLPVVHFPTLQKNVDLMVLWKLKEPKARLNINLRETL